MPRVYPPLENRQTLITLSPSIVESAAGFTAGVVSTLAVHPFDIVKTRLQIEQNERSRPGGSWRVMRRIAAEGGGTRGSPLFWNFYRGLVPNMIGNSVSWALYFMWYDNVKSVIRAGKARTSPSTKLGKQELRPSDYFLASGLSGILTAVLTNPIWVIKTRMLSTARNAPGAYTSTVQGTLSLYREEGLRGFYRGLIPSLFGVSHGAIQFMAYESLKNHWALFHRGGTKDNLSNIDFLSLSAASKMFAGSITYPYQVVRARLQTYDAGKTYKGAWDVVTKVWSREGLGGFYKGLGPNIVRVLPKLRWTRHTESVRNLAENGLPKHTGVYTTPEHETMAPRTDDSVLIAALVTSRKLHKR
ncbi:mitochondrial FAD carrier protein flx1 [Vermiconidia calcicola]|uniref:Mitochondrial FAD carrier protein flx1 n=1 Tax=Vermiconidia calcicola TaxID=1690605 RepID=A0ACC3N5S5_9PEZI|nr:mitochondrial FAD carrier protein flx1 [Vermiconidia calcicola]